jgi:hypothetical protein
MPTDSLSSLSASSLSSSMNIILHTLDKQTKSHRNHHRTKSIRRVNHRRHSLSIHVPCSIIQVVSSSIVHDRSLKRQVRIRFMYVTYLHRMFCHFEQNSLSSVVSSSTTDEQDSLIQTIDDENARQTSKSGSIGKQFNNEHRLDDTKLIDVINE